MINWQFFPKSRELPTHLEEVLQVFFSNLLKIDSENNNLNSNEVLSLITPGLESLNYRVEKSKLEQDKIKVPVLFGLNGNLEKYFDADAYNHLTRTVIEVEAGRALANYQFLKDLFQACVMHNVDYLVIAVRNIYGKSRDFEKMITFLNTLYASNRLILPLKGILVMAP